jgi:hypothetical protein
MRTDPSNPLGEPQRPPHTDLPRGRLAARILLGLSIAAGLMVLGAVGAAMALLLAPDPKPQAPPAHPRTLYLAPEGHDAGSCVNASSPCASFEKAYRAARPGDIVSLAAGVYPGQTIDGDSAKVSSRDVVFRPASGAVVRLNGPLYVYGSHIAFENLHLVDLTVGNYDQTPGRPNPSDVRLYGVQGRDFEIDSATDVTISGGAWGPASACGGPYGGGNNSIRDVTGVVPANISIEHVTIRDVQSYDLVGCHIEGLAIFAGRHIKVSNSKFFGDSVYDVFVQANSGPILGLIFKENWMAMPVGLDGRQNGTVIGFSDIDSDVLVEGNRFNYIISLDDDGLKPTYKDFRLVRNVGMLPYRGCALRGILFERNIWQRGACSPTDINLRGAPLPYANRLNNAGLDYHLSPRYARLLGKHQTG